MVLHGFLFVLFWFLFLESLEMMFGISVFPIIDAIPFSDPFGALVVFWIVPWCFFWIWDFRHKAKAREGLSGSREPVEKLYYPDRWTVAFHLICASFTLFVAGYSLFYAMSWGDVPVSLTIFGGLILAAIPIAYLYCLVYSLNSTIRIEGRTVESRRFSTCSTIDVGEFRKVQNLTYWLDVELRDGTSHRITYPFCQYEDWTILHEFLSGHAKQNREKQGETPVHSRTPMG